MNIRTAHLLYFVMISIFLKGEFLHPATSANQGFGIGAIIGEPTGISFKNWTGKSTAFDGAVAWSFGKKDAFHLHADYLHHNFKAIKSREHLIPLYFGIGGRLKFEDDSKLGVRFPVGLDILFNDAPIDIFLEVVPVLNLAPATDFDLNAAVGARFFFN